ncbi:unnamed protein product [Darwinula stevensoni]|uniref:HAT C-terminal dimerisation domain-containing protein n=1 Tax=Darwinula stevensoni TaxID=69355 RepID=A0A7R9ACS5_9CRUS|nr:unnamed protein product [Darwinula stevensoni]CAG0900095.1 unnamed protein product [Darwinula stevensoni]
MHQHMTDHMRAKCTPRDTIATPHYLLPSHQHPSDVMLFQMKEKVTEKLHQSLAKENHFSFTMDIWSGVESFLSLTVHFVDLSFSLQSRLLHISSIPILHTGENIRDEVNAMLKEWKISRDKVHCIPIEEFTKKVRQDNVSVSVVIPLLQGVLCFLKRIPATEAGIMRDEVVKQLEKRFKAIVENKNVILATILDPRFKADFLKAETIQDVQSILLDELQMVYKSIPSAEAEESTTPMEGQPEGQTFWEAIQEIMQEVPQVPRTSSELAELQHYFNSPALLENIDPLHYWKNHQMQFPGLSKLARKYLSSPATSAASQQAFSNAGSVYCDQWKWLQGKKAEMVHFLNANLKFLDSDFRNGIPSN